MRSAGWVQQAVPFGLFHVLQAGARAENRAIRARGLTGGWLQRAHVPGHRDLRPAYAELFRPQAAAHALRWRQSTLPLAVSRASELGLQGAAFPWRTIAGQECSSYWPAGSAAFHVNADVAIVPRSSPAAPPKTPAMAIRRILMG